MFKDRYKLEIGKNGYKTYYNKHEDGASIWYDEKYEELEYMCAYLKYQYRKRQLRPKCFSQNNYTEELYNFAKSIYERQI